MENKFPREKFLKKLNSDNIEIVTKAMLEIAFNSSDLNSNEDLFIKMLSNEDENVVGLAITCLGHLARIHGKINKDKVIPVLIKFKKNKKHIGSIEDALEDIEMFAR